MKESALHQSMASVSTYAKKISDVCAKYSFVSWKQLRLILSILFFAVVAYVVYSKMSDIEWGEVREIFLTTEWSKLGIGVGLALCAFLAYSFYDVVGTKLIKIPLKPRHVSWLGFICYAFNLNLGAVIGSVAFRYRLYSKLGLKAKQVSKILGFSVASNWLAYTFILSVLALCGFLYLPEDWFVSTLHIKLLAGVTLPLVIAFLTFCCLYAEQEKTIFGRTIILPSKRLVLVQAFNALVHWSLMASVVYIFMPSELGFFTVYAVLLISGLAGAISHVPGGLGVLEATFITFLSSKVDKNSILAALLAYRCVFYLVPLFIAIPLYALFEFKIDEKTSQKE